MGKTLQSKMSQEQNLQRIEKHTPTKTEQTESVTESLTTQATVARKVLTPAAQLNTSDILSLQRMVGNKATGKIIQRMQANPAVVQRDFKSWFSGATSRARVKIGNTKLGQKIGVDGTQKAGLTLDGVTNPTVAVSGAFRHFASINHGINEVDFLRAYHGVFDGAGVEIPFPTIETLVNSFAGRINGLTADRNDGSILRELSKRRVFTDNQNDGNYLVRRAAAELLFKRFVTASEGTVTQVCNNYNAQHGRQAAPVAPGPVAQTDDQVFQGQGIVPTQYQTANLDQNVAPRVLGAGAVNTVYEHKYTHDATPQVFKRDNAINDVYGKDAGTQAGIPEQNPQFAKRSVAMSRFDQLLNTNVLAKTDFAVQNGEFGTVMDKIVGGKSFDKLQDGEKDRVVNDPNFQQSLAKLQLLDVMCGQLDRHSGNYFVTTDTGGNFTGLKGIDNDMAFGKDHTNIDTKYGKGYNVIGGNRVNAASTTGKMGGSAHIDSVKNIPLAFAQQVINLDVSDTGPLVTMLTGLLDQAEVTATVTRINQLKVYLQNLINTGSDRVV